MSQNEEEDFSPWLLCVAVVIFHTTKGHIVESLHPKSETSFLSEEETKSVARLSLPDVSIDTEGDVKYIFRFRIDDGSFVYGSVLFRQTKDSSCSRGYLQKSVVAITRSTEFVHIATEFVKVMGPIYFSFGNEVLEAACAEARSWPKPDSKSLCLNVAGTQIHSQPYPSPDLFQDVPLFSTFGSLSVGLWLLWELALTGQPILVLGPTPDRCSRAVMGICSLIAPIPFTVDFRPYFTIFDRDFPTISHVDNVTPIIVGGTNPFLLRSFEHFPNVVSLGSPSNALDGTQVARRNQTLRSLLRNKRWEKPLVLTREEPLVQHDDKLLGLLRNIGPDPKNTIARNNERLRSAFRDLTKRFLLPLETFLRLRPSPDRDLKKGLKVRAYDDELLRNNEFFSTDGFLTFISGRSTCRDKQFPVALYKKFLSGANFNPWLQNELKRLSVERFIIHRTLVFHTDIQTLLTPTSVQSNSLLPKVIGALNTELAKPERDVELCERIAEHLSELTNNQGVDSLNPKSLKT